MNGLEEKSRHATQSEIDDLLAELGYQGKPAPRVKREEPPVQSDPPQEQPQAAPKPQRIKQPDPPRKAAAPRAPKAEPKPRKEIRPKAEKPPVKRKTAPPVMEFPPSNPQEAPLLDIPIEIPRRKPRERERIPENRLLRKLHAALDENVEEIEVLTTLPAGDGKASLTFAQRAKKTAYFLLGLLFVAAALIGFLTLGKYAAGKIGSFASDEKRRTELTGLLEPVVLMDIQMFPSVQELDNDQILSAAIWDIIMHSDLQKYDQSMGVATVPAVDVEHSAAMLFGTGLTFSHHTVGTGDLQFFYNEDLKSYHIPTAPSFFSYQPVIESIEKNGADYRLTVRYEAQKPTWQQNPEELENEKTVLFTVTEQDGEFHILSAENITPV